MRNCNINARTPTNFLWHYVPRTGTFLKNLEIIKQTSTAKLYVVRKNPQTAVWGLYTSCADYLPRLSNLLSEVCLLFF